MDHNKINENYTLWIMGPTASGKTTIANNIVKALRDKGVPTILYDGDEVRQRMLEIGIRGDAGKTQVISGVNEGEEVVITIREK